MSDNNQNIIKSTELMSQQIEQVLKDAQKIKLPKEHKQVDYVVVNGMGGSKLGAEIVKSVFSNDLKIPLLIYSDYHISVPINKKVLFILSSYSGNTEEILNSYKEIKKKKGKVMVITSGGKLGKIAKKDNVPSYIFKDINNPSHIPRFGISYSITCQNILRSYWYKS